MTFGTGVRDQVFEVIVRQAIAGAPWREICAGPMLVNNINPEDVEAEVGRRLNKGRETLSPEDQQSLVSYIAGWQQVESERKLAPKSEIEQLIYSIYASQKADKPLVVFCKSPAIMYLYLMMLTGRQRSGKDQVDTESSARVATILSKDQNQSFYSNLIESIKQFSSELDRFKIASAVTNPLKDSFLALRSELSVEMQRTVSSDLNAYFRWGFRLETDPIIRRVGNIFDVSTSHIPSLVSEYELSDAPSQTPPNFMSLVVGAPFSMNQSPTDRSVPGEVIRHSVVGLWDLQDIIASGFVVEKLEIGQQLPESMREGVAHWLSLFRAAPMYAFFENVCLVAEYPDTVIVNDLLQPSTRDGAAIVYGDDYKVYAIDGIAVPRRFWEHPELTTVAEIDATINVALRRLMIEAYGASRYLMDSGAELVQEDKYGKLYRKELNGDEPILMICVKNSTMEPDGTYREYFLRVPPFIQTAKEGVAWSFDLTSKEYHPEKET